MPGLHRLSASISLTINEFSGLHFDPATSFHPDGLGILVRKTGILRLPRGRGGSKRRFGVRMRGSGFLAFLCKFSGFSIGGPGSAGSRRWSGGRAGRESRLLVHCVISGGVEFRWKERNVGLTADAAGPEARATEVHFCANFRVFRRLGPKLPVYPLRLGALCRVRRFTERGPGAVLT
jgi:hypothetical protein